MYHYKVASWVRSNDRPRCARWMWVSQRHPITDLGACSLHNSNEKDTVAVVLAALSINITALVARQGSQHATLCKPETQRGMEGRQQPNRPIFLWVSVCIPS